MIRSKALIWLAFAGIELAAGFAPEAESARALALREASMSQSFRWGDIDRNVPLLLGNGDIGGLLDPFAGTHYDELRYGSGAHRDIRTLFLTQFMLPDYWVLEDQAAHFLDPRFYRPKNPRKYLSYGAPFDFVLRPEDAAFPEQVSEHQQRLALAQPVLETRYRLKQATVVIETFVHPGQSLLIYHVSSTLPMIFQVSGIASPREPGPNGEGEAVNNARFQATSNGYTEDESAGEWIILEQVSNTNCPAWTAAGSPGSRRQKNELHIAPGAHDIFVAFAHQSLGENKAETVRTAREAAARGYARLKADHAAWWRKFWDESYVLLPDKRMEQMWYRSQYYLACSLPRRVRSFSPEGAYGVFPAFAGFHPQDSVYHLFAALSSNHVELCKAQIDYLLETLPIAKAAARNIYYLDGARYPWQSTPGLLPYLPGHANDGSYLHEHAVNGWIVEFVRRYVAAYSNDTSVTEHYYPILREVARFFASMATPRGAALELAYVPATGQEETGFELNQKNIFDILVAAKWSLRVASETAQRLRTDQAEARAWQRDDEKLSLEYCLRRDGTYGSFEGDWGHPEKVPSQLIGVVMTSLFDANRPTFLKTYEQIQKRVNLAACAWSPGYYAIAAARLRKPEEALHSLQASFEFSRPPWTLFIENTYQVPNRMPYYLAAHALFVQAVNEMFLQDWSGKPVLFPACPFRTAAFKLRANERVIEARIVDGKVELLSESHAHASQL